MNILHIVSGGDIGGTKAYVLTLLSGLCAHHKVHMVCFTEGEFSAEARSMGIPITVMHSVPQARKRILEMVARDHYELIHCHGARANMMGVLLRRKAGIPIVSTLHSDYRMDYMGRPLAALTYGNINKWALPRFDAWIGISHAMRDMLILRGYDPQRIYSLYHAVDFSQPPAPMPRAEYLRHIGVTADENTVIFGTSGKISPVNDLPTLIRAFSEAQKLLPNMRLLIAGEGESLEEIRALAAHLCPPDTVVFVDRLRETDSFYGALDVNVLTSLSEIFLQALSDGARMGCPAIASAVGSVPYLIDDGFHGLLFPPRDAERLTQHMLTLAAQPELRKKMGRALYEKTRQERSPEAMVERQLEIYRAILRRASRPRHSRDGAVICGAYGKGNGGDNVILSAIVEQLHSIDPDLPICALSRAPEETRLTAGIDSVYIFDLFRIGARMRRARLYISGGGTLLQDATSTRSLLYYLFSIRQAAFHRCRIMLYGCGVGPVDHPKNRKRTARILNRYAEGISVRDHYSLDFLRTLEVTAPRIQQAADPALLIDPPDSDVLQTYLRRTGLEENQNYLMLAVRPWHGFDSKVTEFARAADYAYTRYGLKPLLYCMEPSRDRAAADAVAVHLHCPYLIRDVVNDGAKVIALMRRMSLVLSMRLHPLIFAAGQGVSVVGVVYDPKVSGFLNDLGQDLQIPLGDVTAEALCRFIDEAVGAPAQALENISRLRALAQKSQAMAARLLRDEAP